MTGSRRSPARPPPPDGSTERRALGLLARREHSRAELVRKLVRAGHGRAEAQDAVASLAERGLVSDRRFAETFIRSHVGRGNGPLRIRRDLEAHGVEASVFTELLDPDAPEWEAKARAVRVKRFGTLRPADAREAARQARFLASRGFTGRQVRHALDAAGTADEGWTEGEWERE